MAGPEPGRAWRALALCGAAVFLAAAAAGGALVAWNLAAASSSRGPRCPEPGLNATVRPADPAPELEELRRRLEDVAGQLHRAERGRRELEEALRACEGRQSLLHTQVKTLKVEVDEAKAQGTQMGVANGELTEALARWEASAAETARLRDEAQHRAGAAEAEREACAAREGALRERVLALETELGTPRRGPRPRARPGSRSRSRSSAHSRPGITKGCRRPRGAAHPTR
ncbi:coiled-coil domain-containing protein 194-like [Castor canadensis]|uniref:Coiled-coil domain-containing protein 194-like n=2 Tax=Castor canadensis TaxID=51338 RepID=A0AC58KXC8_CASCN